MVSGYPMFKSPMATRHPRFRSADLRVLASRLQDYYTLTKPEVNLLILMTTSAGYYLGRRGTLDLAGLVHTVLGTLLVASGTATLNQFMERGYDSEMRRTEGRPLPAGRIAAGEALVFGLALSVAGGVYLWLAVNRLTALLAVGTLLSYLLIYTPLKRKTPLCTLLGAFPGAPGSNDLADERNGYPAVNPDSGSRYRCFRFPPHYYPQHIAGSEAKSLRRAAVNRRRLLRSRWGRPERAHPNYQA